MTWRGSEIGPRDVKTSSFLELQDRVLTIEPSRFHLPILYYHHTTAILLRLVESCIADPPRTQFGAFKYRFRTGSVATIDHFGLMSFVVPMYQSAIPGLNEQCNGVATVV
jgi:hypothetical protein